MNPSSVDLKSLLNDSSVGYTLGTDMFIGGMPDMPHECICLYDTGGIKPTALRVDRYPTLMIHVRGNKNGYVDGYSAAELVFNALHGKTGIIIGSTRYISITASSDIIFLGNDEKERPVWSMNFLLNRTTT